MVGSTAAIIDFIRETDREVIVVTERGVVDKLSAEYPGRLHQLCPDVLTCPDMKRTTLTSVVSAMEDTGGEEIAMDAALMDAARRSLANMIELGK